MSSRIDVLIAKARGFTVSHAEMTEQQRTDTPNESYGNDYNQLRRLALDAAPDLEDLMPPEVSFREVLSGMICVQSFGEINTFCEQIVQLLSTVGK
jgi:hypothetical protein